MGLLYLFLAHVKGIMSKIVRPWTEIQGVRSKIQRAFPTAKGSGQEGTDQNGFEVTSKPI